MKDRVYHNHEDPTVVPICLWWKSLNHEAGPYSKDQHQLAEQKLERADRADPPPIRRRKWRELEARLQRLREHYIAGRRDLASFWKAVSRNVFL
ncbi:unnamed protein product [Gadus morhua 'NCC']